MTAVTPIIETSEQLDPKTFNLQDWLVGGDAHRIHKETTLALDADAAVRISELEAELDRAEARLNTAKSEQADRDENSMESIADSSDKAILAEEENIKKIWGQLEELQDTTRTALFRTRTLSEREKKEVMNAWKEESGADEVDTEALSFWAMVFAKTATLEGQHLTSAQWMQVAETIGMQFSRTIAVYTAALNVEASFEVSPRFRS